MADILDEFSSQKTAQQPTAPSTAAASGSVAPLKESAGDDKDASEEELQRQFEENLLNSLLGGEGMVC